MPDALGRGATTRTNVLSLVDKAEKQTLGINLRETYDRISDVIHPSFGSHKTFMAWTEAEDVEDMGQDIVVTVASDARHLHNLMNMFATQEGKSPISSVSQELESIIRQGAIWALEQLTTELPQQRLQCDDMYLTLKLSLMKADYFGDETWRDIGYDPSKIVRIYADSSGDMFYDVLTQPKED